MVHVLFNILFLIIPLIFFKNTSELFEFNKIIAIYIFTILISASWIYQSLKHKTFIFRPSILDIPIILYLGILTISTFFSIDPRTSIFGYYSRFNGGLLSQVCYAILYFAFVSNITTNKQKQNILISGLVGTTIASILAIFEHFGLFITCGLMNFPTNTSCWVQDVQNRVFSTMGQPNWLAALVVVYIPIAWYFLLNTKNKIVKTIYFLVSSLLFLTLIFTKSRSGILAFGIESLIFFGYLFYKDFKNTLKIFLPVTALFSILVFYFYPNNLFSFLKFTNNQESNSNLQTTETYQGPALETGGTESGVIRKYVWQGAINIFKNYPVLGSGPETFAFVFPKYKPVEHNLTSEWDFIYNKAHNEFLNFLATTGVLGFTSYIALIIYIYIQIIKNIYLKDNENKKLKPKEINFESNTVLNVALLSSFTSILVTNFFGFSVVAVSLLFFLIPAFSLNYNGHLEKLLKSKGFEKKNKLNLYLILILIVTFYLLYLVVNYFRADVYYNKAKNLNRIRNYNQAVTEINKAIKLSPNESNFHAEASVAYSEVALLEENKDNEQKIKESVERATDEGATAVSLSKRNTNSLRILSSTYYKFAIFNNEYLLLAEEPLVTVSQIATNDPKVYYQLGILYLKNNKPQLGLTNLEKSVELKPNYKEGRFALGLTYIDLLRFPDAVEQFQYILNHIDPNDNLTKKYLEEAASKL